MSEIAPSLHEFSESGEGRDLAAAGGGAGGGGGLHRVSPKLPILLNAHHLATAKENMAAGGLAAGSPFRYVEALQAKNDKRAGKIQSGVLRGIKDLQRLQKQTLAVLESVKANLEDIQQVLRSPEATRGLEKQQNAATLLSKGFARDAVEQSIGAVALLPANPEAHLLLSLSLAADQQFDNSLAAARKGLALFDRRTHPLAIEAGLLHALAALGCGAEAAERWGVIIEGLPVPVLLEHLGRIAACFPSDAPDGQLDEMVTRRLTRETAPKAGTLSRMNRRSRMGLVETRPGEIPAPALFAGLDAAHYGKLAHAHRAILGQVARRLNDTKDATDILRFLTDCVVPLGNIGLERSAGALGRATVKRLLRLRCDAMMLHRAMQKLEMAGATAATRELAILLDHWRREGAKLARARRLLVLATSLLGSGSVITVMNWAQFHVGAIWAGPACILLGAGVGVFALMGRTWTVELPHGRPSLSAEELRFIGTAAIRQSLRGIVAGASL